MTPVEQVWWAWKNSGKMGPEPLRPASIMHHYQGKAAYHQLYHPDSMLWLGMSLGKSVITLSSIDHRMKCGQVQATLIFGPVRVIHAVWAQEARKWEHTKHLTFSVVHGAEEKRLRNLFKPADIYLCNYENMAWLSNILHHYYIDQGKPLPFQMCVYDEISRCKTSTSQRIGGGYRVTEQERTEMLPPANGCTFEQMIGSGWKSESMIEHQMMKVHPEVRIHFKGWKKVVPHIKYRTGLTGTPASNGYIDLHGQYLCVDGGERLGKTITGYRESHFVSGWNGFGYEPHAMGMATIERKIADITLDMATEDYLELPETIINDIWVDLPPKARKTYEQIEDDMFTVLDCGTEVELFNQASVSCKCLQVANGACYRRPNEPEWTKVHDAKLEALDSIIEEAAGHPVAVSYLFKIDAERIMKRYKRLKPVNVTETAPSKLPGIIKDWVAGKIKLLVGHAACLHADTLVLTERDGWVKITEVKAEDRVFDGIEFVSHSGCSYSGYKEVIDVLGITMTPNHKLLVDGEWLEAKDVGDCRDTREKASYKYKGDDKYLSEMFEVRGCVGSTPSKCEKAQPPWEKVLRSLCSRHLPQHDKHENLAYMDGDEVPSERYAGQKLWWSWDRIVRRMGRLQELLLRHARNLRRWFNYRTSECELRVFKRELCVDTSFRPAVQQTKQPEVKLPREDHSFGRAMSCDRAEQDDVDHAAESWDDPRTGGEGRSKLPIQKEHEAEKRIAPRAKKTDVYDLVNCGERHRFLIKNNEGDIFISHNSMGHGVDGLQDNGDILVELGNNWSLELMLQMRARFMRQGRDRPLRIFRIMVPDTVDVVVAGALDRKEGTQQNLRDAINRYRAGKGK